MYRVSLNIYIYIVYIYIYIYYIYIYIYTHTYGLSILACGLVDPGSIRVVYVVCLLSAV